ncbi:MAG: flagellar biosynthesis protein FlhF [Bacteroidetes bacterium]|nr:flagellar biosynthesis protein FlhF [Bacteroidota bacterium]MCW5895096.1 flagellar biosynthesis protein FlhF [Bacteroidota bacterium]
MQIKKFTGTTLKAATDVMRSELGENAIILNTRTVPKGGVLNFLRKDEFEITAAIDEEVAADSDFPRHLARAGVSPTSPEIHGGENTFASLQKVARQFEHRTRERHPGRTGSQSANGLAEYHDLKGEVEQLRSVVEEIAIHLKYSKMPTLPEHLKSAYTKLVGQDVNEHIVSELVQGAYRSLGEDRLGNKKDVEQHLLRTLSGMFKTLPSPSSSKKPRIIALVGPTGVGKTTTVAKLAAIHKLIHKQNVALISADTYRIGAIEQLRTFAAIADIPMEVVYKPAEMKSALSSFKGKDVVLIDTVGRSQRMKREINELAKFVGAANPHEVHLVLNSSTQSRALEEILERFKVVTPNRVIFSKLDEAVTFGQMVNIAHRSGIPISYITTGQSVPDDIKVASNVHLAQMVYTGELTNV